jgi:recombination protein RecA
MRKQQIDHIKKLKQILVTTSNKLLGGLCPTMASPKTELQYVSTGDLAVDLALGGGIPLGRMVEVYGHRSSGKTALALSIIKQAQLQGLQTAFIDVEHTFNRSFATQSGVDLSKLLVGAPTTGEQALLMLEELVSSQKFSIIVVDSIAAISPPMEIQGGLEPESFKAAANFIADKLYKIISANKQSKTTVLFLNQLRSSMGQGASRFISPGGKIFKSYCSIILEVNRLHVLSEDEHLIGTVHLLNILKHKSTMCSNGAKFTVLINEGVSKEHGLFNLGLQYGFIQQKGSWYIILGEPCTKQGESRVVASLVQDGALAFKLETILKEKLDKC